jgi:hypothetical protein
LLGSENILINNRKQYKFAIFKKEIKREIKIINNNWQRLILREVHNNGHFLICLYFFFSQKFVISSKYFVLL